MTTETLRPNAAGDVTQLAPSAAPNWECVNEAVANGDTDYVQNATANTTLYDLYNIPDSAIPVGSTINSVTIYWTAKKMAVPSTRAISGYSYIKTEATEYQGTQTALTTSYVERNTAYALNPKTGLAWTLAELNALQIGVLLGNNYLDDLHFAYGICTQVYVVIDYTAGGAPAARKSFGDGLYWAVY